MTRREAKKEVSDYFGASGTAWVDKFIGLGVIALVQLRHTNEFLPAVGANLEARDDSEWAFIDMSEKVDTGMYGCVYYFGDREK